MLWPTDNLRGKLSYSHIVCQYYWPKYILPHTQIVQTHKWNFIKAAIKHGVPAISSEQSLITGEASPDYLGSKKAAWLVATLLVVVLMLSSQDTLLFIFFLGSY
ncbi:MAG: hypothetical protein F6K14_04045 [Symploca sp. SIO2C1]|nr:hypothetical protein [Symploca sp. SIO2C1]